MTQILDAPIKFKTIKNPNILNFAWELKKNGRVDSTIESNVERLQRLQRLCDLEDPEQVKVVIATAKWQNSTKQDLVQKYDAYLKFLGKTWTRPTYKRESKIPYIPTEKELDSIIQSGSPKTTTFLQFLKETGARKGEAVMLKWTDIDREKRTVYIHAEKGSNDRILPISEQLLAMLYHMERVNDKVFQPTKKSMGGTFTSLRNRTAVKLNNPRLRKIHLHTFRHWKATQEQHKTHDIYHVKQFLGHKTVKSTEIYIHIDSMLSDYANDRYITKVAHNIEEDAKLIEVGFEYITERDGLKIYKNACMHGNKNHKNKR